MQDRALRRELRRIAHVLPRATAAAAEDGAARRDAIGARREHRLDLAAREARVLLDDAHAQSIAGCGEWHEDDAPARIAPDAFATRGE
ncbi:MAG: hypothetical protein H6Q91_3195 [Deltaproteobacteria bacterium]|nr:hypothetical protein [Deltaproteobacteria bacterium]